MLTFGNTDRNVFNVFWVNTLGKDVESKNIIKIGNQL